MKYKVGDRVLLKTVSGIPKCAGHCGTVMSVSVSDEIDYLVQCDCGAGQRRAGMPAGVLTWAVSDGQMAPEKEAAEKKLLSLCKRLLEENV